MRKARRRGPRNGESPTSARRLAQLERDRRALDLRAVDKTNQEIADALGFRSPSGAARACQRALDRVEIEEVGKARAKMVRRLEIERAALMRRALGEDPAVVVEDSQGRGVAALTQETALDRALAIDARLAKLQGLDAPTKSEVKATLTEADALALVDEVVGILRDVLRLHVGETLTAEGVEVIHGEVAARVASGGGAQAA